MLVRARMAPRITIVVLYALGACVAAESAPSPDRNLTAEGKSDGVLSGSCSTTEVTYCGGQSAGGCHCDDRCATFHDCCEDAAAACGVESNRLGDRTAGETPLLDAHDIEIVAN